MSDCARFVLDLSPRRDVTFPGWMGRAAHAWFLRCVEAVHPPLSRLLHDHNGPTPFTVSSLSRLPADDGLLVRGGESVQLIVTTLDRNLTLLARNTLQAQWQREGVSLRGNHLMLQAVDVTGANYDDLLEQATPADTLTLHFETPTVFKQTGGGQITEPLPEYVFGSLLQRWQAFCDVPLLDDLAQHIADCVRIDEAFVRMVPVAFAQGRRGVFTGFTGSVTYAIDASDEINAQIHALASFARYSAVGAKTAYGLGMTALQPQGSPSLESPQ